MLEQHLRKQLQNKSLLFMTHMVCGYPSFADNWEMLEVFEEQGVDLVEMQFPFSEPVADGALFAQANQAALEAGVRIADCFSFLAKASVRFKFPILMMGYYNTVFRRGEIPFCAELKACGGVGLIIPDITIEESQSLQEAASSQKLALIPLVAPTTPNVRLPLVLQAGSGFVYAVARKGVTGAATNMDEITGKYLQGIHVATNLPVAVGFGISHPQQIRFLRGKAEIAVLGSAFLSAWQHGGKTKAMHLLSQLCQAALD